MTDWSRRCIGCASQGYSIALDDWISFSKLRPLLPVADIVKIDIQAFDAKRLVAEVGWLKTFGVQLVAEKVQTYAELRNVAGNSTSTTSRGSS